MGKEYLRKRLNELLLRSENRGIYTYSDFLSEQDAAYAKTLSPKAVLFGGAQENERVIVRFGDGDSIGYEEPFPIRILRIVPVQEKFADELTHRDFLGALMNLGIERDVLGDILVKGSTAFVFAEEKIADYITDGLRQVRHTTVRAEEVFELPEDMQPHLSEEFINVASSRLDAVVSRVWNLARTKGKDLFAEGKVLVNGVPVPSGARSLTEGDRVTVRGFGKFIYRGIVKETKKSREVVRIERYV
ncbi:MAG: hypothetical protein J6I56_01845 [Lachnospiraceae bacterium]|nr:hypothetical protein [Lachnospiraceae bacterium]